MRLKQVNKGANQYQSPNFVYKDKLYLVRCFVCTTSVIGRENWAPIVAEGKCAWCGWKEVKKEDL